MEGKTKRVKKSQSSIIKGYLFVYNAIEAIGWSFLLFNLIKYHIEDQPEDSIFERLKWFVIILPNSAVFDILHAVTGLVLGNPVLTAQAIYFRIMLVCGTILPTLAAKETIGFSITLLAWSFSDAIRYSFYALNLVNAAPYALHWLRISTFMVVVPIGLCGEVMLLYKAQEEFSKTGLWSPSFANISFNFQYFLIFNILFIIVGSIKLYFHMLGQRKKVLRGLITTEKKHN